jgi:hypothetical protein
MAYGTYLAYVCPCKRTLSCHLVSFYSTVGLASFLVAIENGLLFRAMSVM